MNWRIEIKPSAEKQYLKLDKKTRQRIKNTLKQLQEIENSFIHANIRPLTGKLKGDYRIRIGNYRVLLTPDMEIRTLYIYAILPRGDAY